jgi:hypothetical protein
LELLLQEEQQHLLEAQLPRLEVQELLQLFQVEEEQRGREKELRYRIYPRVSKIN